MSYWPSLILNFLLYTKAPGLGIPGHKVAGSLTFGARPPAGLGGGAAARGWWVVPQGTAAQGRSEQIQGAWVQTESLELLSQEAETLCLAAALLLELSNPGLSQDPP